MLLLTLVTAKENVDTTPRDLTKRMPGLGRLIVALGLDFIDL